MDMPYSTYNDLVRRHGDGAQDKSALVNEYLSQHPYPRWGQIVQLLKVREKKGKARAGLAQEVKDKYTSYMTSEYTYRNYIILFGHNLQKNLFLIAGVEPLALHSLSVSLSLALSLTLCVEM